VADYNLGCSVQLDDERTLTLLEDLSGKHAIGHIQVQIVPLARPTFRDRLAAVAATAIPTAIHAPHHSHGVNPCAPAAYDDRPLPEIEEYIEEAMAQTYEAADALGAEVIVLHAGRYLPGERAAAEDEFPNFLDRYPDPRLALENLPAVYAGYPLLGNTAHDLGPSPAQRSPGSASTSPTSPAPQTTRTSRSPKSWSGSNPSTSPSTTSQTYGAARSPTNTSNSTTPTAALTLRRSSPGSGDTIQPRRRSSTRMISQRSTPGR
jgi:hypothetical protein